MYAFYHSPCLHVSMRMLRMHSSRRQQWVRAAAHMILPRGAFCIDGGGVVIVARVIPLAPIHTHVKCGNLLDLWHSRLHYTLLLAFLPSFSCSWINTHTSGIAIRARYLLFPTAVCELAFDHHHAFCAWQINFHSTSSAISWNNNKWKYAEKPQTNNSCRWAMKILDVKDSVAAECIPCAVRIGHHLQQAGGHLIRKTAMVAQKLLRCIWVCVV